MWIRTAAILPRPLARRIERDLATHRATLTELGARGSGSRGLVEQIDAGGFDLVIVARERLGPRPVQLVTDLRQLASPAEVVVVGDREDPAERAALLAAGALAILSREVSDETFAESLVALVARCRENLLQRVRAQRAPARGLSDFVSNSPDMQRLIAVARRVRDADTSLLILGETGVGKEWLARAMHDEGPRGAGPFIAVNCGALPETLLESELFGHERGAFTGALRPHRGHFELADSGTLFLDEIGDLPLALQVKLLRVLQDHRIRAVGAEREIEVDVRVIAATNRDLAAEMRAGRFRPDLYYRLGVVTLRIPPLRDRRDDVPPLVEHHLARFGARFGRPGIRATPEAERALLEYEWPGNVRELINVLERAVLLSDGPSITLHDLPDDIVRRSVVPAAAFGAGDAAGTAPRPTLAQVRAAAVAEVERRYLTEVLRSRRGRIADSARCAGISSRALFTKMQRLGLRKEDFRVSGDGAHDGAEPPST